MGSADEYKVDLDALDEVVKKINNVLKSLQDTKSKAKHGTYIGDSAFGVGFGEAKEIYGAQDTMREIIEGTIIKKLEDLVDDLSQKTAKTRGAYEDQEHEVQKAVHTSPSADSSQGLK